MTFLGGQLTWRSHFLITDFMTEREDQGSFTALPSAGGRRRGDLD